MGIIKLFGKIGSFFAHLFTGENLKKATAVVEKIKALLDYALPAAAAIAQLTPTRADDELIALINRFKLKVALPAPGTSFDKVTIQAILMNAAGVLVRENLTKALQEAGREGLQLAGQVVKDHTEIPDNLINAAVNNAVAVLKVTNVPAAT